MLVGVGWAFLAAGALLFFAPSNVVVPVVARGIRRGWTNLVTSRQLQAAAAMPVALVLLAVGIGVAVGIGWGLATAGVSVASLSLYTDRMS